MKSILQNVNSFLMKGFNTLFCLTFIYILLNLLFYPTVYGGPYNSILLIIGALIFILFLVAIYSSFPTENKRVLYGISSVNFIILLLLQTFFFRYFKVTPTWDFGAVFQSAVEIVESGQEIILSRYFYFKYPNNIPILLIYIQIIKILQSMNINDYLSGLIIFNTIIVNLSVFFTYYLIRLRFGLREASLFSIFMLFVTPFYTYTTIVYTDTLSMIFPIAAMLLYYLFTKADNFKKKYCYLLLIGIVLAIGSVVKTNVIITLVAIFIHLIITYQDKHLIPKILLLIVSFYIPFSMMQQEISGYAPPELELEMGYPATHWILMGMLEADGRPGGYNADIVAETEALKVAGLNQSELAIHHVERIREVLKEYGFNGYVNFLKKKVNYTWADGTYYAFNKLARSPIDENKFQPYVIGEDNRLLFYICQMIQTAIIILIIVSGMSLFKSSNQFESVLTILLFGVFLFLLLWEARSRYLVLYIPIISYLALHGLKVLPDYLKKLIHF